MFRFFWLSSFPGKKGRGWGLGVREQKKNKLRNKMSQSPWGPIVPHGSDFALCCSSTVFRNTSMWDIEGKDLRHSSEAIVVRTTHPKKGLQHFLICCENLLPVCSNLFQIHKQADKQILLILFT